MEINVASPELWSRITQWDNLIASYHAARAGKKSVHASEFGAQLEENIIRLQGALISGEWEPGPPNIFPVRDPKPRTITAPPFADRVVHHALVRQIEPLFERRFINESFACRKGRGVHVAVQAVQDRIRITQYNYGKVFVLKADISKYFASINHVRLLNAVSRVVRCRETARLIKSTLGGYGFIDGVGLPVGALTSQLFANVYLDQLDHFVKDEMGVHHYVRYMDDFVIIHHDKAALWEIYDAVADYLATQLSLRLNRKTSIMPASHGVDFCGYRIWTTHKLPRKRNMKRARQRLATAASEVAKGADIDDALTPKLMSFLGYAKHANTYVAKRQMLLDLQQTIDLWEIVRRKEQRRRERKRRKKP